MDVSSMFDFCAKQCVNSAPRVRYVQTHHYHADNLYAWKDYKWIEKDYLRLKEKLFTAWGYFCWKVSLF